MQGMQSECSECKGMLPNHRPMFEASVLIIPSLSCTQMITEPTITQCVEGSINFVYPCRTVATCLESWQQQRAAALSSLLGDSCDEVSSKTIMYLAVD